MATDREHIATLEQLLARKQGELRTCEWEIAQGDKPSTGPALLQTSLKRCQAEADALEWALELLTKTKG